jgi:carbamoyl-phosphate synthase small subunit
VVAYDFDQDNILRLFDAHDCRVTVVPRYPADAVLATGRCLPLERTGDPAAAHAPQTIRALAAQRMPMFGICLGHQLLGLSFGGHTEKMPFGHRGGNQPVKDLATGKVLITAQNHGFAVAGTEAGVAGAPDLAVTHINLNDGTVEGLRHRHLPIFAVRATRAP